MKPMRLAGVIAAVMLIFASEAAGAGWYLIAPHAKPARDSSGRLSYTVPASHARSNWQFVGAFDSASECEVARQSSKTRAAERLRASSGKTITVDGVGEVDADILTYLPFTNAECIASDDPRLK